MARDGMCVTIVAVLQAVWSSGQNNGRRGLRMQQSSSGTRQQRGNPYTPFPTRLNGRGSSVVPVVERGGSPPTIYPHPHHPLSLSSDGGILQATCGQGVDGRTPNGHVIISRSEEESDRSQSPPRLVRLPPLPPLPPSTTSPSSRALVNLRSHPRCCSVSPNSTTTTTQIDYLHHYKRLPQITSDVDLDRLRRSMQGLQEGCYYYQDLDSNSARSLLQKAPEGTFLVRDSSDPRYLFSITVKTARGATSARIRYDRGLFQLDCDDHMKQKLPRFETLLDLLDFHRTACQEEEGDKYRWQESSRRRADLVIRLTSPRRHSPPTLAHLAHLSINQSLQDAHLPPRSTDLLPVPDSLKQFLRGYPFKV